MTAECPVRVLVVEAECPVRVLVVEDEAHTRRAIVRALKLLGYQATAACTGKEALAALASVSYDVMLLDLQLPELNGVAVMEQAHTAYPELLIIVLTAYASTESAIVAVRAGAVDYLIKPCRIRKIEATIARAVAQRNEQRPRASSPPPPPPVTMVAQGPLALDEARQEATLTPEDAPSVTVALTSDETALLAYLLTHPETVLSCRELAQGALDYTTLSEDEAKGIIRPHIWLY